MYGSRDFAPSAAARLACMGAGNVLAPSGVGSGISPCFAPMARQVSDLRADSSPPWPRTLMGCGLSKSPLLWGSKLAVLSMAIVVPSSSMILVISSSWETLETLSRLSRSAHPMATSYIRPLLPANRGSTLLLPVSFVHSSLCSSSLVN